MFGFPLTRTISTAWTVKVWLYIALGGLVLGVAVFGAGYGFGHGAGKEAGLKELQAFRDVQAKHDLNAQIELTRLNRELAKKEQAHVAEVAKLNAVFLAERKADKLADARRAAEYRSGERKLRFAVNSCSTTGQTRAGPSGTGASGPGTAELTGDVAAALDTLASRGDAAIKRANALSDWTDSALKLCNGDRR